MERCQWAIAYGVTLNTRCQLDIDHTELHEGKGLKEFQYQRIRWSDGDRREYQTGRDEEYSWEEVVDASS